MKNVKTGISLLIILSMLAMLIPVFPVYAGTGPVIDITYTGSATLNASNEYEVRPGDTISLKVSVSGITNLTYADLLIYNTNFSLQRAATTSETWLFDKTKMVEMSLAKTTLQESDPIALWMVMCENDPLNNPVPPQAGGVQDIANLSYTVIGEAGDDCAIFIPDQSIGENEPEDSWWYYRWYDMEGNPDYAKYGNQYPYGFSLTDRTAPGTYKDYGGLSSALINEVTINVPKFKIVEGGTPTKTLTGLSIGTGADAPKAAYNVGDTFDFATGKVIASYSDSTTQKLALNAANVSVTGFDSSAAAASQTITVSYTEGSETKTATYNVAINALPKTLTSIAMGTGAKAPKTAYTIGDTFDYATGKVIATYSDSSTQELALNAAGVTVTGFNSAAAAASQTITVSYLDGVTKTTTYNVSIADKLNSITIGTGANAPKNVYIVGQPLDKTVGNITANYASGAVTVPLTDAKVSISGFDSSVAVTGQTLTVTYTDPTYGAKTATYTVNIDAKAISSLAITGTPKASYEQFQPIDNSTAVRVTYNDSTTENYTFADCTTNFDSSVIGTGKTVTVSYGPATAQYTMEVVARTSIDSIVVNSPKTEYYIGDSFDATSSVTVNYTYGAAGTVTLADCNVAGFDSSVAAATQTIDVSYGGKATSYTVAILAPSEFNLLVNDSAVTDIKVAGTLNLEAATSGSVSGYTFQFGYKDYDELADPTNLTAASATATASFDVSALAPGKYYAVAKVIKGGSTDTLLRKFVIEEVARKGEVLVNGYGAEINLPKLPYYKGINISYTGTGAGETYSIEYRQYDFAGTLEPTGTFGTETSKDFPEFLDGSKNNTYYAVVFIKDAEGAVTFKTLKYFVVANSDITATINVNNFDYTKSEFPVARIGDALNVAAVTNKAPADLQYSYKLIPWDATDLLGQGYTPTAWSSNSAQQIDTSTYAAGTYKVILYVKYEGSAKANWDVTFWRQFVVLSASAVRGTANVAIGNGPVLTDSFVSIAKGPASETGRNITASLDLVNYTTAPSTPVPATTKFAYKLVPYDLGNPAPVPADWTSDTSVTLPIENLALGTYRLNVYVSEDNGATVSQVIYRKYVKVVDTIVTGNIKINDQVYAGKFDPVLSKVGGTASTIALAFDELTSDTVAGTQYKFEIRTFDNVATSVPETAWSTTPSVTGLDISALPVNTYLVKVSVKHGDNTGDTPNKVYFKQFFKIAQ